MGQGYVTQDESGGLGEQRHTKDVAMEEPEELTKNELFDILRNSRRRSVISCLLEQDQAMTVEELTRHVAADEYETSPAEVTARQYKRVYTGLYQCHFPRMQDLGVIDFDAERNLVSLRPEATRLSPYVTEESEGPLEKIELGLAVVISLVVISGLLGIGPFAQVSAAMLAMLTAVALLGVATLEFLF